MRKQHLNLLSLATRLLIFGGLGEAPNFVARRLMNASKKSAARLTRTATLFEGACQAVVLARTVASHVVFGDAATRDLEGPAILLQGLSAWACVGVG